MKVTPVNRKFGKYQPGEVFDLPDRPAKVLIKVGRLAEYKTTAVKEEAVKDEPRISPATGKPVRQYTRRDMRAED